MPGVALPAKWRRAALPLGAAALLLLLRTQLRLLQRRRNEQQHAEARRRVRRALPAFEDFDTADEAAATAFAGARWLADSLGKIASILGALGEKLNEALVVDAASSSSSGPSKDPGGVAELLAAWRSAGDAEAARAQRLLGTRESLIQAAEQGEGERSSCLAELEPLEQALLAAEAAFAAASQRGWFLWLRLSRQQQSEALRLASEAYEGQQELAKAAVLRLARRLEAAQQRVTAASAQAAAAARPLPRIGATATDGAAPTPVAPQRKGSGKIQDLARSMSTAEGRQQLRAAEEAKGLDQSAPQAEELPLQVVPAFQREDGSWRVQGIYEHQALKVGLRRLDSQWDDASIAKFPRGKDGGALLFREGLFKQLLAGTMRLQSITNNDVSAAQRDVDHLSLRQQLRLRVQHLDFNPSGCGADSVSAVGGTHEAFLSKLDGLLFRRLGRMALGDLANEKSLDHHKVGREAVLFAAASSAVASTAWWCWWLSEELRVFFHAGDFSVSLGFPSGAVGVLELTDLSRRDKHEPTGRLRWLDWRVDLVTSEAALSAAPPKASPGAESQPASPQREDSGGAQSPRGVAASGKAAAPSAGGPAGGPALSVEVLAGARRSLRRTSGGPTVAADAG